MELLSKQAVLDLYFMEARARLIDLAAFLDRVERAAGEADFRLPALRAALEQMTRHPEGDPARAKNVLLALSDPTPGPLDAATVKSAAGAWSGPSDQVAVRPAGSGTRAGRP